MKHSRKYKFGHTLRSLPFRFQDGGEVPSPDIIEETNPDKLSVEEDKNEEEVQVEEKSIFDKIYDKIIGEIPKSVTNWLEKNGDIPIKSITLGRTPVKKYVNILLNIITNGKYNQVKNKIGYDNFYHLFMIVELENNKKYIIEKNQTIKISDYQNQDEEHLDINNSIQNLTVNQLLNSAYDKYGKDRINTYNALSTNCQRFIIDLLSASNLLTISNKKWILQDIKLLSEKLAQSEHLTIKKITNIGSYVDRFLQKISNGIIRLRKGGIIKKQKK